MAFEGVTVTYNVGLAFALSSLLQGVMLLYTSFRLVTLISTHTQSEAWFLLYYSTGALPAPSCLKNTVGLAE